MRVFVTGATGFIGSAVVRELIGAGHTVIGLARSDAAAKSLAALGAQAHPGALHDPESLRQAAAAADGVIHLAFIHGFSGMTNAEKIKVLMGGLPGRIVSRFMGVSAAAERRAIDALGSALQGSGRPLVVTFGTMGLAHDGQRADAPATEEAAPDPLSPGAGRAVFEEAVQAWASRGVRASMIRLAPSVHGEGDTGLVPQLIGLARKKGVSAYVGDGQNRWPAVHRLDAAHVFRLALEKGVAGARYHGVAEEGVAFCEIAEMIGRGVGVPVAAKTPEQAPAQFGWLGRFVATDNPTSSQHTRDQLDWQPKQMTLMADIERSNYFTT